MNNINPSQKQGCVHCVKYVPHYIKKDQLYLVFGFGHCIVRGHGIYLKEASKICSEFMSKRP